MYPAATRQAAGHFNKIQQDELGSRPHSPLHHSVLCLVVQGAEETVGSWRGSRDSGVMERKQGQWGHGVEAGTVTQGTASMQKEQHYGRIPQGPGASQLSLVVS